MVLKSQWSEIDFTSKYLIFNFSTHTEKNRIYRPKIDFWLQIESSLFTPKMANKWPFWTENLFLINK